MDILLIATHLAAAAAGAQAVILPLARRTEYGFPEDADTDPNDVGPWRITFLTRHAALHPPEPWAEPIWYRTAGPWRRHP